jgi:predicted DsbA family dithiol-disulfide isomerase
MSDNGVHVDVFADIACPWCYVGERRLQKALDRFRELHADVDVEAVWRPFELQPDLPKQTTPWDTFIVEKFGSAKKAREAFRQVSEAGAQDGISFDFECIAGAVNTRDAHRLMVLASEHGVTWRLAEALFRAYFTDGRDVGNMAVLAEIASASGIDRDEALAYLRSDAGTGRVEATQELARRIGIGGVPFYVLNSTFGVSGAQPVEALVAAMEQALAADMEKGPG